MARPLRVYGSSNALKTLTLKLLVVYGQESPGFSNGEDVNLERHKNEGNKHAGSLGPFFTPCSMYERCGSIATPQCFCCGDM